MSDLRIPDLNKVFLAGRLTRDPELRYLTSGTAVCKLGMAVSRFIKSRDGERKEETFFINVEVWDKSAEYCNERLRKGRPVLVEGRLKGNEWEDKTTGQKRSTLEIRADRIQELDWEERSGGAPQTSGRPASHITEEQVPEDDMPF